MTIKEALNRVALFEARLTKNDRYTVIDEARESVLHRQFQRGAEILVAAGVPEMLEELAEIIRPDFPDVRTKNVSLTKLEKRSRIWRELPKGFFYNSENVTVSAQIGWNYREGPIDEWYETEDEHGNTITHKMKLADKGFHLYDSVVVLAIPDINSLFIDIFDRHKHPYTGILIPEDVWSTPEGRTVLEDAIIRSYRNPAPTVNDY